MPPRPIILFHPTRQANRVAAVQVEAVADGHIVRVTRGPHPDRLEVDRTSGPLAEAEVDEAFAAAVAALRDEGYERRATVSAVEELGRMPRNARQRAMAAGRLFWLADGAACEPLLTALGQADAEACSILDALGRCGDERAFVAVRESAGRKLLSRRRSGVEALIGLGDDEGLATATERVRSELPDGMIAAAESGDVEATVAAMSAVEANRQGQTADFLYEWAGLTANATAADAALRWAESQVGIDLGRPFVWRYVKSLFKRATLRLDADAFGRLSRLVDASLNRSRRSVVKSGLTGQSEPTVILSSSTRDYLRRRSWRHLRRLAEHLPDRYADHAAALLAAYEPADLAAFSRKSDGDSLSGTFGMSEWVRSFLVGHVLHGNDPTLEWSGMRWTTAVERARQVSRLRSKSRQLPAELPAMPTPDTPVDRLSDLQRYYMMMAGAVFTMSPATAWQQIRGFLSGSPIPPALTMTRPPDWKQLAMLLRPSSPEAESASTAVAPSRPEAYPELWDASPTAYLRLLARGKVPAFVQFASNAVRERHADVLKSADIDDLLEMLHAPLADVAELAAGELRRRLDTAEPSWSLVNRLARDASENAQSVAHDMLRRHPGTWITDADRVTELLLCEAADTGAVAAAVLVEHLADIPTAGRRDLAARLLAILHDPPPQPIEAGPTEDDEAMFAAAEDPRLDMVARVLVEALADEIDELLGSAHELLEMTDRSSPLATVAAGVLARRSDAADVAGLDRLLRLADHDVLAVRQSAMQIVRDSSVLWRDDPTPLLSVAEGTWPDSRATALTILLERVELDRLGVDALQALLDSTLADVRRAAMRAAAGHLEHLDAAELAGRLAEHPGRDVRDFAFDLAAEHLPAGGDSFDRLRPLVAASLYDVTPSRPAKAQAIHAVTRYGLADEQAAQRCAELLFPMTRSEVRADREAAVAALAKIKLYHPDAVDVLKVSAIGGAA